MPCRRLGRCLNITKANGCAKTHYINDDEWRDELTARLKELDQLFDDDEKPIKFKPWKARNLAEMNVILDKLLRQHDLLDMMECDDVH